jgi:hypothetical protein
LACDKSPRASTMTTSALGARTSDAGSAGMVFTRWGSSEREGKTCEWSLPLSIKMLAMPGPSFCFSELD